MTAVALKPKPVETVPIPPKMRLLARDRRGYPVPWIVQRDLDGRPFFVMNDVANVLACGRRKLCGICGKKLERDCWFVGGPGAALHEHGAFLDPPMHRACATYALQVCPYIASRYTGRVDAALVSRGRWDARQRVIVEDGMIPEQPPFFVLAKTATSRMNVDDRGAPRFHPRRPWLAVEFWRRGVEISDAEARDLLTASDRWPWVPDDLPFWPQAASLGGADVDGSRSPDRLAAARRSASDQVPAGRRDRVRVGGETSRKSRSRSSDL